MKENTTTGLIMLKNDLGIEHKVAKIEYTVREDESFEYVFFPCYSVIDLLPTSIFQGIPGLDLELRLEKYVRSNVVPVFISERTPGPNRVNLQELLEEAGMKFLNPLEWLIRTDYVYSGDPLYVNRFEEYEGETEWNTNEKCLGAEKYARQLASEIALGKKIRIGGEIVSGNSLKVLYNILMDILSSNKKMQIKNRQTGIRQAETEGRKIGRRKKEIDEIEFFEVKKKYQSKELTADEAIRMLNISRSTFFRRLKEK